MKQRKLTKHYYPDSGEITYTKDEDLPNFERFKDDDKGFLMIASNRKLIHLLKPGFPADLKAKDLGYVIRLCDYLEPSGIIMDRKFPMTRSRIAEVLQIHRNSATSFLDRLEALALGRWHDNALYINPLYLTVSTYLPPELYAVYKAELDPQLQPWVIAKYNQILQGGLSDA